MTDPIITTEEVWNAFMNGFGEFFKMLFSNPYTILVLAVIIVLIIISKMINKKK